METFDITAEELEGLGVLCDNYMERCLSVAVENELITAYDECKKLKIRNTALKEISRGLREDNKELSAQNEEMAEQLELVSSVVDKHLHGSEIHIGCSFNFDKEHQYATIYGKYCERHKIHRPSFCVMGFKGFNQLLTKRDVLRKKQEANDDVHKSLKDQLAKMKAKLKNQQEQHDKRIEHMKTLLCDKKRELAIMKGKLERFKHDFREKIQNELKHQNQIKEDAYELVETYEQYHQNCIVLKDYAVLEQYINNLCFELSGKKRDYNANPTIYNNIYTLLELKANEHIKDTFNINIKEFKDIFISLKSARIEIAHPDIEEIVGDIAQIKEIVGRLSE